MPRSARYPGSNPDKSTCGRRRRRTFPSRREDGGECRDGRRGIHHSETPFERFNGLESTIEFGRFEIDQARVLAIDERGRPKRFPAWVREGNSIKAEMLQEVGDFIVLHQAVHCNGGQRGNAMAAGGCEARANAPANAGQAAVALVVFHGVAIDRHEQRVKTGVAEAFDGLREMPTISDHCGTHAGLTRRGHQTINFRMHQRLAALKIHIPDTAAEQERQRPGEPGAINPALVADEPFAARK